MQYICLEKGTYAITKEEKMALRSDSKNRRAEILVDPGLLESHKAARMLVKKRLTSAGGVKFRAILAWLKLNLEGGAFGQGELASALAWFYLDNLVKT